MSNGSRVPLVLASCLRLKGLQLRPQVLLADETLRHVADDRHHPLDLPVSVLYSWMENSMEICRPSLWSAGTASNWPSP